MLTPNKLKISRLYNALQGYVYINTRNLLATNAEGLLCDLQYAAKKIVVNSTIENIVSNILKFKTISDAQAHTIASWFVNDGVGSAMEDRYMLNENFQFIYE